MPHGPTILLLSIHLKYLKLYESEIPAPCWLKYCPQQPNFWINQHVHHHTNGERKCGTYTQYHSMELALLCTQYTYNVWAYICTYYSVKKNEIIPFSAKWTKLRNITFSKISQTQKDVYHMFSLMCGLWNFLKNKYLCV